MPTIALLSSSALPSPVATGLRSPVSTSTSAHLAYLRCISQPSSSVHYHGLSHHNFSTTFRPCTRLRCEVAVGSDAAKSSGDDPLPSSSNEFEGLSPEEVKELKQNAAKVGSRVRVKVPLKVFHVPRVPEVELTGVEGEVKQYVPSWKGKRISANYPFKIEFKVEMEGRGLVKFFAHLKEDELEFI